MRAALLVAILLLAFAPLPAASAECVDAEAASACAVDESGVEGDCGEYGWRDQRTEASVDADAVDGRVLGRSACAHDGETVTTDDGVDAWGDVAGVQVGARWWNATTSSPAGGYHELCVFEWRALGTGSAMPCPTGQAPPYLGWGTLVP